MKIVFNTNNKNNPTYIFYADAFHKSNFVEFEIHDNYKKYDIALFVSYPEDLNLIKKAKKQNRKIKIGVIDPRSTELILPYLNLIDFFLVDSIEMSDFWLNYSKPVHLYYEYPNIETIKKKHTKKKKIIIGYHGNKVHLTSMFPNITKALEILNDEYEIEFWAVYNKDKLGLWNINRPKNVKSIDIQWNENIYKDVLSKVDIGIIPSLIPVKENAKKISTISKFFLGNMDDYILRFKMLSNPGRLIIFGKLGIPVVAEMSPSNIEFIENGKNGYIAYSTGAWYHALKLLIDSHKHRNYIANNMREVLENKFDFKIQNKRLKLFLEIINKTTIKKKEYEFRNNPSFIEKLKFNNSFIIDTYFKFIRKYFNVKK